ncbi:MAG: TATA-box-binding protein [Candidatus Aenigmarchaeota archaeon]|nr:TATA-box-binding protein [Candidatus Aenigmarchaeota archaeon]
MVDLPIRVENVVAVALLGVDVPLDKLVSQADNANYEPEPFSGLVFRTGEKGVASLIFSSGKIVCTGAKSIEHAKEVLRTVVDKIGEIGVKVPAAYPIEIESMVASSRLDSEFSLHDVASSMESAEYDPARFPGLIYNVPDSSISMMLFADGRILCSGARSEQGIKDAIMQLVAGMKKAGVHA